VDSDLKTQPKQFWNTLLNLRIITILSAKLNWWQFYYEATTHCGSLCGPLSIYF
jgi:hypothetical protein